MPTVNEDKWDKLKHYEKNRRHSNKLLGWGWGGGIGDVPYNELFLLLWILTNLLAYTRCFYFLRVFFTNLNMLKNLNQSVVLTCIRFSFWNMNRYNVLLADLVNQNFMYTTSGKCIDYTNIKVKYFWGIRKYSNV